MIAMRWYNAEYQSRPNWGHTVRLTDAVDGAIGETVDPDDLEEVIHWAIMHSQARRISYDTWQFRSQEDAESFIMLYNLTWS